MMEKVTMVLEEAANPVPMAMPMAAPSRSNGPAAITGTMEKGPTGKKGNYGKGTNRPARIRGTMGKGPTDLQ